MLLWLRGDSGDPSIRKLPTHTHGTSFSSENTYLSESQPSSEKPWHSSLRILLRTLSLKLIPSLSRTSEKPKIAIHKSRRDAAIRCLVHLIPLGGALSLIALNLSSYWIAGTFPPGRLVALQFAAKLHEIAMVSSLTATMLSYIRAELTSEAGMPFGAAFVGFQIAQPAYLWSSDFWGAIQSKTYNAWFKIRLVLVVLISVSLAATLGPASAACMIPRDGTWPLSTVNRTKSFWDPYGDSESVIADSFWLNKTVDEMYAVDLPAKTPYRDSSDGELFDEDSLLLALGPVFQSLGIGMEDTSVGWFGFLKGQATPLNLSMLFEGILDPTLMNESTIDPAGGGPLVRVSSRSSTQFQAFVAISRSLFRFVNRWDVQIENTMDPYSQVDCYKGETTGLSEPLPTLKFRSRTGVNYTLSNYLTDERLAALKSVTRANDSRRLIDENIFFVDFDDDTIGLIHTMVRSRQGDISVTPCMFELGWFPSSLYWQEGTKRRVFSGGPPVGSTKELRKAKPNRAWLSRVNPRLPSRDNGTLFNHMSRLGPSMILPSVSTSALLTIALSNTIPSIQPEDFAIPGSAMSLYNQSVAQTFPLWFPLKYTVPGFGYGANVAPVQISLVILFLYCVVTISHIAWSVGTGISSSAWDSISEIVALAINSRPAQELQNTCAGIQGMDVFKKRVRVAGTDFKSCEGGSMHLELLFASGDGSHADNIVANEKYGAIKPEKRKRE